MENKFNIILNTFKACFTIIGSVIGAGFITGGELVRFFPSENFTLHVLISGILFFAFFSLLLYCGKKLGGFNGMISRIFKSRKKYALAVFNMCSLCICATMLAGIDSLFFECFKLPKHLPVFSVAALIFAFFVCKKGAGGIGKANCVLVPLVLIFIFTLVCFKRGGEYVFYENKRAGWILLVFLYVGVNVFLTAPVVCDLGKTAAPISALFSSAFICTCAQVILFLVYKEGANAVNSDMPLLYVVGLRGATLGKVFALICLSGILTSLISSCYTLIISTENHKRKGSFRGVCGLVIFILSRIGLKGIIDYLYPLFGVLGIILIFILLFYTLKNRITAPAKALSEHVLK